jgi:hypothetical protein
MLMGQERGRVKDGADKWDVKTSRRLHVGVAAAHVFVERGFDKGESFSEMSLELSGAGDQSGRGGGKFGVNRQRDQAFFGECGRGFLQVIGSRVQVLGVARVGEPDGCVAA